MLARSRISNRIRATWSHPIGAEADFQHFTDSEIFSYQRNYADLTHINRFLFSFQPFTYCFIDFSAYLERELGLF